MKSEKRKNKIGVKAAKGRSNKLVGGGGAPSRGKLCTNVCPVADLWMNCAELYEKWGGWLCKVTKSKRTPLNLVSNDCMISFLQDAPGGDAEARKNCKATCTCQGKIRN